MLQWQASQSTRREAHAATMFAVRSVCPAAFYGTDEQISKPNLGTRWRC